MGLKGKVTGVTLKGKINRLYELRGYSAYDLAVLEGFEGTQEEWLASLKGDTGDPGQVIHTDADGAVLDDVFAKKSPLYKAGVGNVTEVISNAEAGATVQLEPGDYPLLTFTGEYGLARAETKKPLPGNVMRYPENLTIVGGVGVTVAGISLTSGVYEDFWNCDNSNAVLPKGLTLKDLKVSVGISLRNGIVDNLSIINCHITSGSISIAPNLYKDQFGSEESEKESNHRRRANIILPPIKNLIIRDCVIDDAKHETIGSAKTAIYVQCVDNATIEHNTINWAQYNGIQVTSPSNGGATTGKIAISDNTINYSGSSSIRVSSLRDATLWVVSNRLYDAHPAKPNDYIKVTGCERTTYHWYIVYTEPPKLPHHTNNMYDGNQVLSVGNGISVELSKEDYVVAQGKSGIWEYRKWASGMAECWACPLVDLSDAYTWERISQSSEYEDYVYKYEFYFDLPFKFVESLSPVVFNANLINSVIEWVEDLEFSTSIPTDEDSPHSVGISFKHIRRPDSGTALQFSIQIIGRYE